MSKRSRARNKQLRNRKKKQKQAASAQRNSTIGASDQIRSSRKLSLRTSTRLAEATNLIDAGELNEAKEILVEEDRRHSGHPGILEDLLWLYQTQGDHHSAAMTAERLLRIRPKDAEVRLSLAQGYLFSHRSPMALKAYREFLDAWPNHEYANKAGTAVEILEPQIAEMLDTFELTRDEFNLLVLHDEVLFELSANRMDRAISKARELLEIKPHLVSARNNLTLALFQSGKMSEAVATCRETLRLFPDNRFAEATLGRYLVLSGKPDEANAIADNIANHPADQQDAIAQQVEFLSLLGRDADVQNLVKHGDDITDKDPRCCALLCHHRAVALARQGQLAEAETCWKEALEHEPHFDPAKENLVDIQSAGTHHHAPWPHPLAAWISKQVMDDFSSAITRLKAEGNEFPVSNALQRFPHLRKLVPALLDRGDEAGRKFAFMMASAVKSPEFLDALHEFAFSRRGPDAMRNEALTVLRENGRIGPGPHRIFVGGQWTDIELFSPEITDEPTPVKTPELQQLHEEGYYALSRGDDERAETIFRKCIAIDPDDPSSWHNLAGALMQYGDDDSLTEVRKILNDLRQRFPDYLFARTSLAQLAIDDGDLQAARDLIAPLRKHRQMHRSEIMAYFSVAGELAFAGNELESVEQTVLMMEEIDPDHPNTTIFRRRLDFAKTRGNLLSGPKSLFNRLLNH